MTRPSPPTRTRAALTGAICVALGVAAVGAVPALAQLNWTDWFMNEQKELQIAEAEHPKVLAQFDGAYEDPALQAYLDGMIRFLGSSSNRPDIAYRVTILNSPIVNAFALPAGYIYISRGLLALAGNEAEVAGVLAHEIGHVTARHTAQRYGRGVLASIGIGGIGILGAILDAPQLAHDLQRAAGVGATLYIRGFSRDQELESDRLGVEIMARSGYDPFAMSSFLTRLQGDSRLRAMLSGQAAGQADRYSLLSTHPRTGERVARATAILFALDSSIGGTRRPASRAVADLALVTGNVGKPGAGVLPLCYGANDQGAWDMGVWPSALPGHEFVADPQARARLGALWGAELPDGPGAGSRNMIAAARSGRVKAMLLMGDHVHYEDGTVGDAPAALEALEFLVVTDAFLSPAAQRADVVLPAAQWAEKQGTFTNLERRVQPLARVLTNKAVDSRSDLEIICGIARRMGASGFAYDGPEQVLDEIGSAVPAYAGISYARLLSEAVRTPKPSNDNPQPTQVMYSGDMRTGLQWPCTSAGDPGTPVLYAGAFRYGKARLGALAWHPRPRQDDSRFPLLLAHGRVLAQPARPAEVVAEGGRNRIEREEELLLNPDDAARLGLAAGRRASVTTAAGSTTVGVVRVSEAVVPGVVSLTTLFGELAVSLDGAEHPDPMNHIPRLNAQPARVEAE